MKNFLVLFMLCSFATLSGCQTAQNEGGPTNEPRETIIKEAPFHQGESIHAPSEPTKCYVTGCNNSKCHDEQIEKTGCRFFPKDICYEKANCKLIKKNWYNNELGCGWEKTAEFKKCEIEVDKEIEDLDNKFEEQRIQCGPGERCTFLYSFRDDNLEFTLPYGEWPSFSGVSMTIIGTSDYDDIAGTSFPVFRVAIDTDEYFIDSSKMWDVEEIQVTGASGIKYKTNSIWSKDGCDAYRLEYKDKFYYFEGYEGCLSFGNEFSDSLRFF